MHCFDVKWKIYIYFLYTCDSQNEKGEIIIKPHQLMHTYVELIYLFFYVLKKIIIINNIYLFQYILNIKLTIKKNINIVMSTTLQVPADASHQHNFKTFS